MRFTTGESLKNGAFDYPDLSPGMDGDGKVNRAPAVAAAIARKQTFVPPGARVAQLFPSIHGVAKKHKNN